MSRDSCSECSQCYFCYLLLAKQVTELFQIQMLGKETPAVDERSCKIHIAKWYGFGAVMENSCDYFYNSPKFAWIVTMGWSISYSY